MPCGCQKNKSGVTGQYTFTPTVGEPTVGTQAQATAAQIEASRRGITGTLAPS